MKSTRRLQFKLILVAAAFAATLALPGGRISAQLAAEKTLPGHVPEAAKVLQPIGRLPGSNRLNLAIGLPVRDQDGLNKFLQQVYDPVSPSYRQYLTPEQFTEMFGPTTQDYQAVIDFAEANGLQVGDMHPNRMVLDVSGTVADIERTFRVALRVYQHPTEPRTFYAPDVEPSVDEALPILDISGLDNYSIPHPNHIGKPLALTSATPDSGSGPGGNYRGADFRAAYLPGVSLTGSGQKVGLLQFDGYYANDITLYESQAGLASVPLTIKPVDGGVSVPGPGNEEVALDIEMVIAMAPGVARIYVYEAPNNSAYFNDLLSRMANDNLAKQLSCSWTNTGGPNATAEQIFQQMAAQGQTFFAAAGDTDAYTGSISFPCDSPSIVVVGGTTLSTTGAGGPWSSETVWNSGYIANQPHPYWGSSGGFSTYYSIPVWQQGISMTANHGSTTKRNIPDVALTASNVYSIADNGSELSNIGTSCAAPLWAGFTALVNQQAALSGNQPVGFLNPALYSIGKGTSYTSDFHDTTAGNNTWPSSPSQFYAATGYDLCTGWGTPRAALLSALAAGGGGGGPYTLTVSAANGTVTKNPNQASYTAGTQVTLTANPFTGYYFSSWSGDASGSANPLTVTMNSNKNIVANFATSGGANLTPYKPAQWSDDIVVTTTSGATRDTATLKHTKPLYVDWAVINNGTSNITTTFYTYLYIDGVFKNSWFTSGLNANYYTYVIGYSIGTLASGNHSIMITTDATNVIPESNENDNSYTKQIFVN